MSNVRVLGLIAAVLISTTANCAEVPADLAKAVHDYDEAQVHGNKAELRRLVADDYTLVNSSGHVQTKAELIKDYTTPGYKIEPFVRQLIRLMDELKAGQSHNSAKLTRPARDESRRILFAAIANTVDDGGGMAAYHTAFRAGLYAYENSLDHLLAFMEYLDRLRQSPAAQRKTGPRAEGAHRR